MLIRRDRFLVDKLAVSRCREMEDRSEGIKAFGIEFDSNDRGEMEEHRLKCSHALLSSGDLKAQNRQTDMFSRVGLVGLGWGGGDGVR